MKRCGKCREAKPLTECHRRGRGLQTWCKTCRRDYDARYHRATRKRRVAQKKLRHAEFVTWYQGLKSRVPSVRAWRFFDGQVSQAELEIEEDGAAPAA